jgi:hypothetical protein
MQPTEQGFDFLWIEHRWRNQQRRRTSRDQGRIGLDV